MGPSELILDRPMMVRCSEELLSSCSDWSLGNLLELVSSCSALGLLFTYDRGVSYGVHLLKELE